MTDTAKRLAGPTQLTTSPVDVYTVPGSTTGVIRNIHIANTSASAADFWISIGTTGIDTAASRFYDEIEIAPDGAFDWSGFLVLAAGECLVAKASAATALTITLSGVEIS